MNAKSSFASFFPQIGFLLLLLPLLGANQAQADSSIRIKAGTSGYVDSNGQYWNADSNYQGGASYSTKQSINNTSDPTLYQNERYGAMAYTFNVPNGNYNVTLKFAELYFTTAGQRVFNVAINNTQVLSNFDIFASAGGQYKAIDKSFPVVVTGGVLYISFNTVVENPKIDAIEINLLSAGSPTISALAIRVNAGGPSYTDSNGNFWSADANYQGGYSYSTSQSISNTSDPTLYQTERYGTIAYAFSVPNGNYNVILKFAELYWDAAGERMFNVAINNAQVLSSFDIFAAAGGQFKAIDKSFPVTVSNGAINIAFTAVVENPKIGAIEIDQINSTLSSPPPPPTSGVLATSANTFLNSLGVNTHISQGYDQDNYVAPIQYLGIRNIRDQAVNLYSTYLLHKQTGVLANIGVGCDQIEPNADNVLPYIVTYLSSTGSLLSIEGPNEPNNWPITYNGQVGGGFCATCTWVPVAACQRDLYAAVKSNAFLQQYPVLSVSLAGAETDNVGLQFLTVPSGSQTVTPAGTKFADYANQHNYVSSNQSTLYEDNQAWIAADTQQNTFPGDILYNEYGSTFFKQYAGLTSSQLLTVPRVTTETGWDSVGNPGGEVVQGKVLTNTYLAQFKRGVTYTFIYELIDGEGGSSTQGLFHADYTPKLAATYIHNLTGILADNGSLPSPGTVNYSIAGQPATVHDLLLQKSDGTFELVIWDERASASDSITVALGASFATVNVYDVISGVSPIKTLNNSSSIPLTLSDHAVILEFK